MMVRIEYSFAILLAAFACQSTTVTTAAPGEGEDAGGTSSTAADTFGGSGGSDTATEETVSGGTASASLSSKSVSRGGTSTSSAKSAQRGGSGGDTSALVSSQPATGGTPATSATVATGGFPMFTLATTLGGSSGIGGATAATTREPDSCHMWQGIQDSYGKTIELEDLGLCYSNEAPGRYWCGPGGQCRSCADPVSGGGLMLDCDRDGVCETDARSNPNCGACGNICPGVCELKDGRDRWYSCSV